MYAMHQKEDGREAAAAAARLYAAAAVRRRAVLTACCPHSIPNAQLKAITRSKSKLNVRRWKPIAGREM